MDNDSKELFGNNQGDETAKEAMTEAEKADNTQIGADDAAPTEENTASSEPSANEDCSSEPCGDISDIEDGGSNSENDDNSGIESAEADEAPANESDSESSEAEGAKKEGVKIYSPLIIATIILALMVVGSSVYFLFFTQGTGNTVLHKISGRTSDKLAGGSICGTWLYRLGDVPTFYTFTEDGKLEITSGTVTSTTKYAIDTSKSGIINVYSSLDASDDDASSPLSYSISKEDGITTLKISDPSDATRPMMMQLSSLPDSDLIEVSPDFKADESALGTWADSENGLRLTLTADGKITIKISSTTLKGTYVVNNGELTYTYTDSFLGGHDQVDTFNYEVNGDNFKFYTSNYEYNLTKVKDTTK